jgi:hypothetical protein
MASKASVISIAKITTVYPYSYTASIAMATTLSSRAVYEYNHPGDKHDRLLDESQ